MDCSCNSDKALEDVCSALPGLNHLVVPQVPLIPKILACWEAAQPQMLEKAYLLSSMAALRPSRLRQPFVMNSEASAAYNFTNTDSTSTSGTSDTS